MTIYWPDISNSTIDYIKITNDLFIERWTFLIIMFFVLMLIGISLSGESR